MNTKDYLVSIVVPIYNVESYLPKCIESIQNQTHKNLEIILVDDGSTDECGKICDAYAKTDNRIYVIHKQNGGITTARKAGVRKAVGDYIGFVDADDWIDTNMYEELLNKAVMNNADIVLSDMYREKFTGERITWSGAFLPDGLYKLSDIEKDISNHIFPGINSNNNGINGGVHIKLFKNSILKEFVEKVDDRIHGFADDNAIVYPALLNCNAFYVYHKAFYHGVDRKDSATHTVNKQFFEQAQLVYDYFISIFEKSKYKESLISQLNRYIMHSCINTVNQLSKEILLPMHFFYEPKVKNKKIILYGAGKVGTAFYKQLTTTKYCDIVLWCDKKENHKKGIFSPLEILEHKYDYIVVAIAEKGLFEIIKKELLELNIPTNVILWGKRISITEYFENNLFNNNENL